MADTNPAGNITATNEENNVLIAEATEEENKPWEWQHDTSENQNINRSAIESVHESLNSYPINAEVIVRNGVMVDEYYKEGYDENSVFTLQSTSKSVTSALIGIAIDKGYIESVDVPLSTYFPQILESGSEYKNQLTIWHLLTHTTGLDGSDTANWNDQNSRVTREYEDESLRDIELESTSVDNWDDYDTVLYIIFIKFRTKWRIIS